MRATSILCALAAGLALVAAACGTAAAPTSPAVPTAPAPTDVAGSGARTAPPRPGTFETAWGSAWDALPPGFPLPPGAKPAEPGDPADGPVSGVFVADMSPAAAARAMEAGLGAAGYSTEALSGPLEDGSLVLDAVGREPACRVQARIRERGGMTMITVLFGAGCPEG